MGHANPKDGIQDPLAYPSNGELRSEVVLINPPIVDPTTPPHFAAYLVGSLRENGFTGRVEFEDLSVGALNYLTSEEGFQRLSCECQDLKKKIENQKKISKLDEIRYKHSLKLLGINYQNIISAKKVLTDSTEFYNFALYKGAARVIERYVDAVTAISLPGIISFWEVDASPYGSLSSISDLSNPNFIDAFCAPFKPFLDRYLDALVASQPRLVGISCNYISQLPYVIYLARELTLKNSDLNICIGGTELTDLYKNIGVIEELWKIFPKQVALVVGEGESAFQKLVQATVTEHQSVNQTHVLHENIVTRFCLTKKSTAFSENIDGIGSPDYGIYDLNIYWSPEPVLMYSPTRGCYWNKCTFCDYGLNFGTPTSPSRQRKIEEAETELQNLSKLARVIYFAVDAISPSYLLKLCEMLEHAKINLSWSAEIRLEKQISDANLANALHRSGCIGLSFGLESASERILRLIDKGVDIARVPNLLSALDRENIHIQLMGFVGFPSETVDEAQTTFTFLNENQNLWTLSGIGSFVLTPGATVTKHPEKFSIEKLIPIGDGITRSYRWIDSSSQLTDGSRHDVIRREHSAMATRIELSRPFVGGIDTAHTLLYFRRYPGGAEFRKATSIPQQDLIQQYDSTVPFRDFMEFWDVKKLKEWSSMRGGCINFSDLERELSTNHRPNRESRRVTIKPNGTIYLATSDIAFPQWIADHFI